jgi:hypothetical protein
VWKSSDNLYEIITGKSIMGISGKEGEREREREQVKRVREGA